MFINNRNPESSLKKMALQQHFIFQRSTGAAEQTPAQQCQPVRAWAIVACSSAELSPCPSAAPCPCKRVQNPHPKRQSYEDGHQDRIWVYLVPRFWCQHHQWKLDPQVQNLTRARGCTPPGPIPPCSEPKPGHRKVQGWSVQLPTA